MVEHVWSQMSEPRARFHLRDEADVDALLSGAEEQLRATPRRIAEPGLRHGFTPSRDDRSEDPAIIRVTTWPAATTTGR